MGHSQITMTLDYEKLLKNGSQPLSEDRRDFSHTRLYGGTPADVAALPVSLYRARQVVNDQGQTPYCTGCNTSEAIGYQEHQDFSFEWQIAKIGQLIGQIITNGADPRVALKAGVEAGALLRSKAPLNLSKDGLKVADWRNWPVELNLEGVKYQRESYLDVLKDSPLDAYDSIRVALNKGVKDDAVVMVFSAWYAEWRPTALNPVVPIGINVEGYHAHLFVDFTLRNGISPLVQQNSWGTAYGEQGYAYFPRETVNKMFEEAGTGCYIYRRLDPTVVKSLQIHNANLKQIFLEIFLRAGVPFMVAWRALTRVFGYSLS